MKTVSQKQDMITELRNEDTDLRNAAVAANRELYPNDAVRIKEIYAEIKDLEASIELDQEGDDMRTRLDATVGEGIRPDPDDAPGGHRFIAHAKKAPPNPRDRFQTFGEQLLRVRNACADSPVIDPRLTIQAATGMSEGVPADGGFLVQEDFSTEIFRLIHETGILASRCRSFPISANSNKFKINTISETSRANGGRWGGIQVYRKNEGAAKEASELEFGQIEMSLEKMTGLVYATDELLEDAATLEAFINMALSEEFGFKLDDEIINGTGVGQCKGIMNAACLVTVSKDVGQPAKTLIPENIVDMWARLWARCRPNAVWYINQDIEPQLHLMNVAVGTGGQMVYMSPGGLSASPYATLYGRPVIAIEQCQTLGTSGDIILADLSQYALIEKGGMQAASSIHVKFLTDETTFRFVMRNNGQPLWSSALTPFKGGATKTLSPFVVLETRA